MTYWDPIPTVRALVGRPHPLWRGDLEHDWSEPAPDGGWEGRDWRNVPGPFYTANTDNCCTGRQYAPRLVTYEDEELREFVFRQPVGAVEVQELVCAAECDPFAGYGGDGDLHWTPELVRDWWRERGGVQEWARRMGRSEWMLSDREHLRDAAVGARAYFTHLSQGLEAYLRDYMFWLAEGRPATSGDRLPVLDA
ncbi:ferredoxin [Streptomyces sp. NPDC048560]|uniref:ferredoxin n=1 Tax=Streptomyces sp. NPDC048560 TaxID=3155488 RepID=UPI00341ACB75